MIALAHVLVPPQVILDGYLMMELEVNNLWRRP